MWAQYSDHVDSIVNGNKEHLGGLISIMNFDKGFLALVQTTHFSCAERNVNEQNPLFEFICTRFGTWEEPRLN